MMLFSYQLTTSLGQHAGIFIGNSTLDTEGEKPHDWVRFSCRTQYFQLLTFITRSLYSFLIIVIIRLPWQPIRLSQSRMTISSCLLFFLIICLMKSLCNAISEYINTSLYSFLIVIIRLPWQLTTVSITYDN